MESTIRVYERPSVMNQYFHGTELNIRYYEMLRRDVRGDAALIKDEDPISLFKVIIRHPEFSKPLNERPTFVYGNMSLVKGALKRKVPV